VSTATILSTEASFDAFASTIRDHFQAQVKAHGPLFVVDAGDLNAIYLDHFTDEADRLHHNCSACRHFLRRFGSLAVIAADGELIPALWPVDGIDPFFAPGVAAMRRAVAAGKVTGVFLNSDATWGTPRTGEWTHFSLQSPHIHHSRVETAGQAMALKREHFGTLSRGLAEFTPEQVGQALTLLQADALYRTEKVLGPAQFLHDVQTAVANAQGKERRRNVVWRAVATAPAGFCTPRSSMIGTLLEDISGGLSFEEIKSRFAAKMHPLRYQRPQAPASSGNIEQAEAIVAKLGIGSALRRRFARLDEIETIWRPAPSAPNAPAESGVFGHLRSGVPAKDAGDMGGATIAITWEKFARTVLPMAAAISVRTDGQMNLAALVTAADSEAAPILQWDRDDQRNPVSWYLYHGGSSAIRWGLPIGAWVDVTAVALNPSMWGDKAYLRHSASAIFILDGAADQDSRNLCLFPEILRSELHGVRRTIEQFNASRSIEGADEASACGLLVPDGGLGHRIRVRTKLGTVNYRIDRWD